MATLMSSPSSSSSFEQGFPTSNYNQPCRYHAGCHRNPSTSSEDTCSSSDESSSASSSTDSLNCNQQTCTRTAEVCEQELTDQKAQLFDRMEALKTEIDGRSLMDWAMELFYTSTLFADGRLRSCFTEEDAKKFNELLRVLLPSFNDRLLLLMVEPDDFYLAEMRVLRSAQEFLKEYCLETKQSPPKEWKGLQVLDRHLELWSERIDRVEAWEDKVPELEHVGEHHRWWSKKERELSASRSERMAAEC